jgi:hypothetical protein
MCGTRGSLGVVALLLLAGCAINGHGLVTTRLYESGTAYMLDLEAWGGHLITNLPDAGLTLGHSKRLYIYPKPNPMTEHLSGGGAMPLDVADARLHETQDPHTQRNMSASENPVALVTETDGLALQMNQVRTGILLGKMSSKAVLLPQDFNGIILFKYDSENINNTRIYVKGGYP